MELSRQLDKMNAAELRNLTATLLEKLAAYFTHVGPWFHRMPGQHFS
jgi:hypothetical protein